MARGTPQQRSRSKGPHGYGKPGRHTWQREPDRGTSRPYNVYQDRRNSGSPRRDTDVGRGRDDYMNDHNQQKFRDDEVSQDSRRRASMQEPGPTTAPQFNRSTLLDGAPGASITDSPVYSPITPITSTQAKSHSDKLIAESRAGSDAGSEPGEITRDPRLALRRINSMPHPKSALKNNAAVASPTSPNANNDEPFNEQGGTALARQSLPSLDTSMTDAPLVADVTDSGLLDSLLEFIESAVASGRQLERLNLAETEQRKAKEERDSATQRKLPLALVDGLNQQYDLATESYKAKFDLFQKLQAVRTSAATGVVNQLFSTVTHLTRQHQSEFHAIEVKENETFYNKINASVESIIEGCKSFCASTGNLDQIMALEKKQTELESHINTAQPRFQETIKNMKKKSEEQHAEIQKENSSLKSEVTTLRDEMKEIKEMITSQNSATADDIEARAEVSSLKHEAQTLRDDMKAIKAMITSQNSATADDIEARAETQKKKNEAELKKMQTELTGFKQTMNDKFSSYLTREEIDVMNSNSNKQAEKVTAAEQDVDVKLQIRNLRKEFNAVNNTIFNFETKVASSSEVKKEVEKLGQKLDENSKELADFRTSRENTRGLQTVVKTNQKNINGKFEELQTMVYKHQREAAAQKDLDDLTKKVSQIQNAPKPAPAVVAPSALTPKERMLLNTLESTPKRVNDLENTVLEFMQTEGKTTAQSQPVISSESVRKLETEANDLTLAFNQFKEDTIQNAGGLHDNLLHLSHKIGDLNQSVEATSKKSMATEHTVKSLTSRYNNLSSEKLSRQIAEIVQQVPVQIYHEQTAQKNATGELATKLSTLEKSIGEVKVIAEKAVPTELDLEKAQEKFADLKEFNQLHESMLDVATRLKTLESQPAPSQSDEDFSKRLTELSSEFNKGRNGLEKGQEDLSTRVSKLEGRVAHANDWDNDDDDEEEERDEEQLQRDSNALLNKFKPVTFSDSARSSQPRSISVPFAPRAMMEASKSGTPLRSLTSRFEPRPSLESRIEAPGAVDVGVVPQKRSRVDTVADDEDSTVASPGRGDGGKRRRKKTFKAQDRT